jgi:flagellar M-ring protein FliF
MNARDLISKLPPRGWAVVGGAVFGSVLLLYLILHLATAASYSTLLTGLNPAQTGKITSTLSTQGIPYEIQGNGTAIAVPASETAQARVALASANLLTNNQPDFSLFNSSQLGQSDFQSQVEYQRALEGQLAETIDNIQGINGAQVQLVLPSAQQQLFADSSAPTTAAVLLSGGENLDQGQIHGIAQLVASSVQGLQLSNVTITDDTGALLWPNSGSDSGGGSGILAKQQAQQQYDAQQAAMIDAMLSQTLGPGKAMVQVNTDLNANQQTLQSLTYTGKAIPLTQHTETETLQGTGGGSAATAGAVPNYTPTGTTGNSNYNHKITDTTNGVDKTVTQTTIAPGAINGIKAALYIDSSVPPAEVKSVQQAVSNALGMVPARGDTVSVAQLKFAPAAATKVTAPAANPLSDAKYGAVGLGALLFLFFVTRMLRRRERESLAGEPTWLRELEHRRTLAEFERESVEAPPPIKQLRPHVNTAKRQVEDLVDRDPDRVAMQVRAWMAED